MNSSVGELSKDERKTLTVTTNIYSQMNFVPSSELAIAYLSEVGGASAPRSNMADLLSEIIEQNTIGKGDTEILLPLTSGNDSRAILGASLRVFAASAINCYSYGSAHVPDVSVPRAICARLGVRYTHIPTDDIVWDIDELVDLGCKVAQRTAARPRLDGIWLAHHAKRRLPDLPVMSGYLGDMLSGSHTHRNDCDPVLDFFRLNDANSPDDSAKDAVIREMTAFAEQAPSFKNLFPNFNLFDLLDLGFRQRQRIKPAVTGSFDRFVTPFEDGRWISFWANVPRASRLQQNLYKSTLRPHYPEVFSRDVPRNPATQLLSRLRKKFDRMMGRPLFLEEQGDPRTNASLGRTFTVLLSDFDRRKLIAHGYAAEFDQFLKRPHIRTWNRLLCAVSAEIYFKAGVNFDTPDGISGHNIR
jgi:hypothetical protein